MNIPMKRQSAKAGNQRGIAMVELAIAIPAMLMIMLLTVEVTRVMYQYNTLTKVVRDGSRAIAANLLRGSALTGLSNDDLQTAKQLIVSGKPQGGTALLTGLSTDDVSVDISTLGSGGTQRYYVQVSASYDYVPLFASIGGNGFSPQSAYLDFTLTALSSMRAQ